VFIVYRFVGCERLGGIDFGCLDEAGVMRVYVQIYVCGDVEVVAEMLAGEMDEESVRQCLGK
jgi:hypothetical protein